MYKIVCLPCSLIPSLSWIPIFKPETGDSLKLKKSFHTQLLVCQRFFSEQIINLRDSLDEETVSATSLNSFKNNLVSVWKYRYMKIAHVLDYKADPAPLVKPHPERYLESKNAKDFLN